MFPIRGTMKRAGSFYFRLKERIIIMWTRQELKARGKAAFKANYWRNVLVAFLLSLLTAGSSFVSSRSSGGDDAGTTDAVSGTTDAVSVTVNGSPAGVSPALIAAIAGGAIVIIAIAIVLDIFLWNPLQIGCYAFFKDNVEDGNAELDNLMKGFNDYVRKFLTMFLMGLYTFLWFLLFIIPGLIKIYSYRMVPFIVQDDPELSPNEVITKSRVMMNGQKWNAFVLDLSFIGWFFLSILTLGLVGVFWANPYYQNTNAALYRRLSGQDAGDLPIGEPAAPLDPVVPVPPVVEVEPVDEV